MSAYPCQSDLSSTLFLPPPSHAPPTLLTTPTPYRPSIVMTKVKTPPEDLVYDADGYWLRAACVCVRDDSESEVLLVSSPRRPGRWIIPGGKIQADESPEASAAREAMEEAGVRGRIGRCLGLFENAERKHRTRVYVMLVKELVDAYEDQGQRKRRWFTLQEADDILSSYKPLHAKYLEAMRRSKGIKAV